MRTLFALAMAFSTSCGKSFEDPKRHPECEENLKVAYFPVTGQARNLDLHALSGIKDTSGAKPKIQENALVFFGFPGCGTVCPMALQNLRMARKEFPGMQIYFVSIAPLEDPRAVETFINDPDIIGLVPSHRELTFLQSAFRFNPGTQMENHLDKGYVFKEGRFAGLVETQKGYDVINNGVHCLLE